MDKKQVDAHLLRKIIIFFVAFIGFLTTIKLAIIYYDANFNPYALPSFCNINDFIDCDGVAKTSESAFFGVPLAYWGMFLYLFLVFMLFVDKLKEVKLFKFLEVFKNPLSYIATLGFISFLISMILAAVSVFEIHKLCILCVFTYVLNLLIAVIATDFTRGLLTPFKESIIDFIDALKIKKYLASFIVLVLIATGFLTYTTTSYCFTPQLKRMDEFKKLQKMEEDNPYKVQGNVLGDPNGNFIVYVYTDYRCPICRMNNVIIHRIAKELSGFQVVHKNLPLDMACNKNIPTPFHKDSCMLADYSIASEEQGKFWEFNSLIFEKQPKNQAELLDIAKSIGLNTQELKAKANSPEIKKRIAAEIDTATKLGINGTPAMVINGKVYMGIKPFEDYKEILLKAGAVERR